jgi:hypothetical protein
MVSVTILACEIFHRYDSKCRGICQGKILHRIGFYGRGFSSLQFEAAPKHWFLVLAHYPIITLSWLCNHF